ncbi:MAG: Sec-independent protein translocase protein TatC [Pirellulaceae bacterium]|nr:MAG: Sec-independent protein translocase protein TatC [Pirellulaceae bacterium]
MAKRFSEDDYFAHTTMTFGEHLEELRRALFKGVIGIVVGFLIGMALASHIVRYVQGPLERAMERYYVNVAIEEDPVLKQIPEADRVSRAKQMLREGRMYSYVDLEVSELRRLAEQFIDGADRQPDRSSPVTKVHRPIEGDLPGAQPNLGSDQTLPDPKAPMIRVRVWTPLKTKITSLGAEEPFIIWLKAAFVAGLVIGGPYAFYQVWLFVAAGLYPHEKRYVYVFLPFSIGLFLAGVSVAFFLVFDPVLDFLLQFNRSMKIDPDPRITNWITFVLFLPIGFGIAFQLPLVMLFLNRIGLVSTKAYADHWRMAVLVIAVLSAVLTPADPISMIAMGLPLTVLYFLGLGLCYWMPPIRRADEVYE